MFLKNETRNDRPLRTWVFNCMAAASRTLAFAQPPAPAPALPVVPGRFVDSTAASGVIFTAAASQTSHKDLLETMGSGVAVFDYDNDGRLDLFFVNGAPLSDPTAPGRIPAKQSPKDWNRLYHQRSDGTNWPDFVCKSRIKISTFC